MQHYFTNKDSFEDSVKRRFERKSAIYVFAKNTEFGMNKDNKPFVKIFLPIGNSDEEKWGSVYINLKDKNQYRLINSRDAVIEDIDINKPKTVYFKNHTETWTINKFLKVYDEIFRNFRTSEQEIIVLENVPHYLINYEKGYLKIPVPEDVSVSGTAIVYPKRHLNTNERDTDITLGTKEGYVDCYLYKGNGESVHEKMKTAVIKEYFEDYLRDLEEDIDLT